MNIVVEIMVLSALPSQSTTDFRKDFKMRHGDAHRKFNMPTSQRRALFSNLTNALLTHEQITITLTRAKELRTFADHMITYAKKGDLNSRRLAAAFLRDNEVVSKLFSTLAERYKERNGGYTRVLKLGFRQGDAADVVILELVDYKLESDEAKAEKKPAKKASAKDDSAKAKKASSKSKEAAPAKKPASKKASEKKEEPKAE